MYTLQHTSQVNKFITDDEVAYSLNKNIAIIYDDNLNNLFQISMRNLNNLFQISMRNLNNLFQISMRNGGAEVGCGAKVVGNSVTVLCLYRTGIDGYVPVVHWDEQQ